MQDKITEFQEKGYVIIDDFLPNKVALDLNSLYVSSQDWEQINQVREKHYQHVFATNSKYLPKGDEFYIAQFGRSRKLEHNQVVNKIYDQYFKPTLEVFSKTSLSAFDVRCYQLKQGDFYRSHIDDYAGSIGCVYYINQKWVWDWGGLLHINSFGGDIDFVETIFPKFNRLILLDHKKFKLPHFVSAVSSYAKEPRYSLVSFNG